MLLKLFICVLLVSHSLAEEEEDDGQYSPEKYEKPYEAIENEKVDESQEPASQEYQQSNEINAAVPEAYQQQAVPQANLQSAQHQPAIPQTLHHLAHVQSVPQTYNQLPQQQSVDPQTYQQLLQQSQAYQQNLQQQLAVAQADHKLIQQLQPAVPQVYQQQQQQQQKPLAGSSNYQQLLQQPLAVAQADQKLVQQLQSAEPQVYPQQNSQQEQQEKQLAVPQAFQQFEQKQQQLFGVPQAYQQYVQQQPSVSQFYKDPSTVSQAYQHPAQQTQPITPQVYQQISQHQLVSQLQTEQNPIVSQAYLKNELSQPVVHQENIQQDLQKPAKFSHQPELQPQIFQQASQQLISQANGVQTETHKINSIPQTSGFQQQSVFSQLPITATNYQTNDGHRRTENVDSEGNVIGQYSYVDPNGKTITVKYSAGKDGFKVEGDHLPKAPPSPVVPVPEAPSVLQYNPQFGNPPASSGAIQSQINPFIANLGNHELGVKAASQQNIAPSIFQSEVHPTSSQSVSQLQALSHNQNLYNTQGVQSQPQFNIKAPGQSEALLQSSAVHPHYNSQNEHNQQLYSPQPLYSQNPHAQLKYSPVFQYNPLPHQAQPLNSP